LLCPDQRFPVFHQDSRTQDRIQIVVVSVSLPWASSVGIMPTGHAPAAVADYFHAGGST
jgi:hypothetical protein